MKSCGMLLHISSLPSPYGIGTLGKAAYDFVDFLAASKNTYWQMLPTGPTGYGDSPYQSFSAYAGNPYFIDLDMLFQQGLLPDKSFQSVYGGEYEKVDYKLLYETRTDILRSAYQNKARVNIAEYEYFCKINEWWLDNYSLFSALRAHFKSPWNEWDKDIKTRAPESVKKYSEKLKDEIEFHKFVQYLYYMQFSALKDYAAAQNIKFIGDIPIYTAYDSADVWGEPQVFMLDNDLNMTEVAGVPPDIFSDEGQLWGNPVFNWDNLKKDNFKWWINRIKHSLNHFDYVRIDHFRGFESAFCIPYGKTPKEGTWKKAYGSEMFKALKAVIPNARIIAEDLGIITPEVKALLNETGFPGMKVLQFAFDGDPNNPYLKNNYTGNCVA